MKLVGIEPEGGNDEVSAKNCTFEAYAKRVIDAYLAQDSKFYAGHLLRMLVYDYAKFAIVASGGSLMGKSNGNKRHRKGEFEQTIVVKEL